jgi:hypothetical protein
MFYLLTMLMMPGFLPTMVGTFMSRQARGASRLAGEMKRWGKGVV